MDLSFLESCELYRMMRETDPVCGPEVFAGRLLCAKEDFEDTVAFFEDQKRTNNWNMKMLEKNPSILAVCCYLGFDDLLDLAIEYGVWCELAGIEPPYYDGVGDAVMEIIEKRRCKDWENCFHATNDPTITVLVYFTKEILGKRYDTHLTKSLMCKLCAHVAAAGGLESLQYLRKRGCKWDSNTKVAAASNGHLKILKYYFDTEECAQESLDCMIAAAAGGHPHIIEYLVSLGRSPNEDVINAAASGGNWNVVNYLLDIQCPFDHCVAVAAIRGGHVELAEHLIAFLEMQHLSISACKSIVDAALDINSASLARLLCNNGFAGHYDLLIEARTIEDEDLVKFLKMQEA